MYRYCLPVAGNDRCPPRSGLDLSREQIIGVAGAEILIEIDLRGIPRDHDISLAGAREHEVISVNIAALVLELGYLGLPYVRFLGYSLPEADNRCDRPQIFKIGAAGS